MTLPIIIWLSKFTSFQKVLLFAFYKLCVSVIYRSSRSQVFFKIGVLKNFTIFTEKHLCWSRLLIKLRAFEFLVETSHLLCSTKQMTGFYIMGTDLQLLHQRKFMWILRNCKNTIFTEHLQTTAFGYSLKCINCIWNPLTGHYVQLVAKFVTFWYCSFINKHNENFHVM